ncbi:MAG: transporter [Bdellovibrionota bacterium]
MPSERLKNWALRGLFFCISVHATESFAGRPLITDDAGVVPDKILQLETWIFADERSGQHWVVPTIGVKDKMEFSASAVQGLPFQGDRDYSLSGPILQSKFLLHQSRKNHEPSLALSFGGIAPYGGGGFKTKEWDYFSYLAFTFHPLTGDKLFIHLNIGQQSRRSQNSNGQALLWGVAAEFKWDEKTYLFTEGANGDTYALLPGMALQVGFRHQYDEKLQLDGTIGRGVSGDPLLPVWVTLGIRYLFEI